MEVKRIVTGYLDENCYLLINNNECLVVDPGDEYNKIREEIGDKKVLGVLITHSHFDHIGALRNFLTKRSIKIFKRSNLEENKEYTIGDFKFKAILTPGHSKDSVTFFFEEDKLCHHHRHSQIQNRAPDRHQGWQGQRVRRGYPRLTALSDARIGGKEFVYQDDRRPDAQRNVFIRRGAAG